MDARQVRIEAVDRIGVLAAGATATVTHVWRRRMRLVRLYAFDRGNPHVNSPFFEFRVTSDRDGGGGWSLITDERLGPAFLPAGPFIVGVTRGLPLQIDVRPGEKWTIDVQNTNAGAQTVTPALLFEVEDAHRVL